MLQATLSENQTLSERECNIVKLLAEGKTAKEISQRIFYSTGTVNLEISKMLFRLKCANATQLVAHALINNLI